MPEAPALADHQVFTASANPPVEQVLITPDESLVDRTRLYLDARLNDGPFKDHIGDPSYLPTIDEVWQAFTGTGNFSHKFESPWYAFCTNHCTYEMPTIEYIDALGRYLQERIQRVRAAGTPDITILEVGAGDGKLTHFLRQKLDELGVGPQVTCIATDSKTWEARGDVKPAFPVQMMTYQNAVETFNPTIVLCSWMPQDEDWTPIFRKQSSVEEYILLGEYGYQPATGTTETWGLDTYDNEKFEPKKSKTEQDGFEVVEIVENEYGERFWPRQVSILDTFPGDGWSTTVSFRRVNLTYSIH